MEEIRILFTAVGRRIELLQAFQQAGLKLNKKVILYGAEVNSTAPALAYCDYSRIVVAMNDPMYIQQLIDICASDAIDIVIPTIDTDLLILSQNKKYFEQVGTRVLVSEADKIEICRDKNRTGSFFKLCGLKAPMTYNDYEKYDGMYPCFIKPKDGSSSINAFKIEDAKTLAVYANQISDYVIQPFVSGKEYTIDIFCDFIGNPIYITPRERIKVRSGEVLKTRISMDEIMIKESLKICEIFKPCGPITVQLIQDEKTGDNYYIEINPRYGGGAPLSMKAGARSAEALIKIICGEFVDYQTNICNDGAIYSRFDQSICISEGNVVNPICGVIFDLDDTLYSEKQYVKSGYKKIGEYLGRKDALDALWHYFINNKPAIDEYLMDIGEINKKEECIKIYREQMPDITLYEGVTELIEYLKGKNVKVGIITDGRPEGQRRKIKALGLDKMVDDIIITDELGGTQFRKPCDIAFRIIQTRWKLPFEQIIYIGDNINKDFRACKQLGMRWKLFNNEDGIYFQSCNGKINSFYSLIDII